MAVETPFSDMQRAMVALSLLKNVGAGRIRALLRIYGSHLLDVFKESPSKIQQIEGIGIQSAKEIHQFYRWDKVDRILEKTLFYKAELIHLEHPLYPAELKEIHNPPVLLWALGNLDILKRKKFAVVGTRNPSDLGKAYGHEMTSALVDYDFVIVSGMAKGIDTLAHQTALIRQGQTIGVLGCGLDVVYPAANKHLYRNMLKGNGLLLTEYAFGTKPDAKNFPTRNRVVSGLCEGCLVVESGKSGGSMITAHLAFEQNRLVFAMPFSVQKNLQSDSGTNDLIKKGLAKLVENVEDILYEFPFYSSNLCLDKNKPLVPKTIDDSYIEEKIEQACKTNNLSVVERQLCYLLKDLGETHIDKLAELTECKMNELNVHLFNLELNQIIKQKPSRTFILSVI